MQYCHGGCLVLQDSQLWYWNCKVHPLRWFLPTPFLCSPSGCVDSSTAETDLLLSHSCNDAVAETSLSACSLWLSTSQNAVYSMYESLHLDGGSLTTCRRCNLLVHGSRCNSLDYTSCCPLLVDQSIHVSLQILHSCNQIQALDCSNTHTHLINTHDSTPASKTLPGKVIHIVRSLP